MATDLWLADLMVAVAEWADEHLPGVYCTTVYAAIASVSGADNELAFYALQDS